MEIKEVLNGRWSQAKITLTKGNPENCILRRGNSTAGYDREGKQAVTPVKNPDQTI